MHNLGCGVAKFVRRVAKFGCSAAKFGWSVAKFGRGVAKFKVLAVELFAEQQL
jgi:hypothetical protein